MSDPAVTAYLIKQLCSNGGRLERNHLADILDLSAQQIEQILQDEPLRFPQSYQLVLAQSPLRICTQYLQPKGEEEEQKCPKLHLCRHYLRGLCPPNRRPRCRYSHDVFSDHNHAVLKVNELSGLNEDEIKVLLFQNDHQLLPENCRKYMRNNCDQGEDCTRLHVCGYFMRGECNNCFCKQSHNLLESKLLLTCSWLSQETIQNFQMLCMLKHNERQQAQKGEPRNGQLRGAREMSQGRGKPRDRRRRARPQNPLKDKSGERKNKGPHVCWQSDSRLPSQCTRGQHLGDKDYNRDGENDYDDRNSRTRLDSLMEEWFSPNTEPSSNLQGGSIPQEGKRAVPCTKDLVVSSKENGPELFPTLDASLEFLNSRYVHTFSSVPFNIPKTASVTPILSHKSYQPQTHAPYPTTDQTRTDVSHRVMHYNLSNTSLIPPKKGASIYQSSVLTTPSQPTFMTLKSGPSITSPRPLTTSSISINPSSEDPSTQLKPLTGSARLPSSPKVSSMSSLTSNKLVIPSTDSSFSPDPGIIPSIISAKPSLVYSKAENYFTKSPSTPNQTPVKKLGEKVCSPVAEQANVKPIPSTKSKTSLSSTSESPSIAKPKPAISAVAEHLESSSSLSSIPDFFSVSIRADTPSRKPITKPDAASVIQQPQRHLIDLTPKCTNSKASKSQPTTKILSVTPQKSEKTLDELTTWTINGQHNTKKVSSSILLSELQMDYFSHPTKTIPFTAGNQGILNCQKMKQMNDLYLTGSEVRQSPGFLDCDSLKTLIGSSKSEINSKQKPLDSALKVVNYPPTWDINAVPEIGYKNILISKTCAEFSDVAKMFNKTVLGHKVQKVWRVQNPSLWRAYQWQKDQMKKKNSGIDVHEWQLFHGTDRVNITTICRDNFDWCVCGSNGTAYGQGNYFARDASYAHNYSPTNLAGTKTMFMARVLVGDFVQGEPTMAQRPQKQRSAESYDCCVNSVTSPSIFVVFEKSQAYPEYILEYKKKQSICNIS